MYRLKSNTAILFNFSIWLLLTLSFSIRSNAQEYIYQKFGVDDGLPSSEVYDIYQDKEGYIWFATDKGLSRYNGYEFENFNTSDGLSGNVVLRFYPQKNGQIWCYSFHDQSLFYFDEIFQGFKEYKYNQTLRDHLNSSSIVKSVFLDEENNLHIGGHEINGEIIIQNDGLLKNLYFLEDFYCDTFRTRDIMVKPITDSSDPEFFFIGLYPEEAEPKYLRTKSSWSRIMVKWLKNNEEAVFMTNNRIEIISSSDSKIIIENSFSPIVIEVIDNDHFFIGYEFGGGAIANRNGAILQEFLSGQSITSFLVDHEGGYWFTTLDFGVYYIQNPSSTIANSTKTNYHHISSLVKTDKNELIIGYNNGRISKIKGNRERIDFDPPEHTNQAHVEYNSALDRIFIHSNGILTSNLQNNTILEKHILKLSEPKNNNIFIACNGLFCSIDKDYKIDRFLCPYRIHDVCVWNNDTIIGTPLGIFKYQNEKYISLSERSDLFDFRSDDIDVNDKGDILYVATQGAGVVVYNGNRVFSISEEDGLKSNIVNEVYLENDSTLWVCTNRGINTIVWGENGMMISGMSKKDGLLSNEVADIEIINDTVWVGTKQGLCYFPKNQMNPNKIDIPYLKLKEVIVNNASWESLSEPCLTYNENEIDFVMEGISYGKRENLYYKYRLKDNQNWSFTQNRKIQFSSLTPGNYSFEAKACIDDQNCSEKTIQYKFTVLAPFWKRWWFAAICLSVVGLLIYLFFKIKVLTYNKDVIREVFRLIIKKLKKDEMYFTFRENGNQIRIKTEDILYIKSAGNYIDVHTKNKTHTIRMNIGKFLYNVPDQLEYVRLHRSYIVRIDKITTKSKNEVQLINDIKIPVSLNHHKSLKEVVF